MSCKGCGPSPAVPTTSLPLACLHLGADTGDTVECDSCSGTVRLKLHACERFAECTLTKGVGGVACCATCEDREPILPIRRVRIPLEGHHFNGSIFRFGGKALLATRFGWARSRILLHELSDLDSPRVLRSWELKTPGIYGAEDPRLFEHGGLLHVAFTAYDGRNTRMGVLRLDRDLRTDSLWFPRYSRSQPWEKNWSFFEAGGELLSVYSGKPWRVLRHEDKRAEDFALSPRPIPFSGGEIRGGASPVLVGDEFYHWFHGFIGPKPGGWKKQYSVGVVVFDAKTLLPTRATRDPVLLPEATTGADYSIIYPCGAILEDGRWHISYGFADQDVRIAQLATSDVERAIHDLR